MGEWCSLTHGDFHLQCARNELLNLVQLTLSQVDGYQQQQLTVGAVALTCPGGRKEGGGRRWKEWGGRRWEEGGGEEGGGRKEWGRRRGEEEGGRKKGGRRKEREMIVQLIACSSW